MLDKKTSEIEANIFANFTSEKARGLLEELTAEANSLARRIEFETATDAKATVKELEKELVTVILARGSLQNFLDFHLGANAIDEGCDTCSGGTCSGGGCGGR